MHKHGRVTSALHFEVTNMQDQTLANGRKPGSSDRNEKEVARMDHDAQKQRDQKTEQGVEEKDKDARRQMGIEHPGRILP
jgi:hypothetical protein